MAEDQEKKQEEAAEAIPEGAAEAPAEESQVSAFPDASVKAGSDLEQARAAVSKVAIAEEQLKELMGAWFDDSTPAEAPQATQAQQPVVQVAGDQASSYPAQAPVEYQQTTQVIYDANGQSVQVAQPQQGQVVPGQAVPADQQGYWRGFQPVQPAQPQPIPQAQPQAVPPAQPYQQTYGAPQTAPQVGQQAGQPAAYGAQPQGQPAQPQTQPMQPGQPQVRASQPYAQPAQPQGQPAQPQPHAQPTGYSQAYTPQIQQPAGYVPAQDFTVQPQPATPAYAKSNRSTLAIVVVVIVALLAIIAAIIMGRILASAGEASDNLIEQLTPTEQQDSNQQGDGQGGQDQGGGNGQGGNAQGGGQGGGQGNGNAQGGAQGGGQGNGQGGPGGEGKDQWGFDWDDNDDAISQNGAQHIYGGDIDADDGELHDAWNKSVSYNYTEGDYSREGIESIDFYNKTIGYDFDIEYPQLTGDIPNLEEINKTIRDTAMVTVASTYENPTSEAREMLELYASDGYGVPKSVDAILESEVDYAISYNNDDFISICFSDEYSIGSWMGGFISLRTVNVNLKTGEIYTIDDVLEINDEIAAAFIDNLSKYDEGNAEQSAGRDNFIGALQGKGSAANNVSTTFYIDGNGKVNFGATYSFTGKETVARGWWDYTLTDDQLNAAKKDSSMWDCIK